jgi:glyoxylase-like metal-dependent hydrolase (beta-lactamase superfamily II)
VSTAVHHLNCASMAPAMAFGGLAPKRLVAHCLVVEGPAGLTLVDTGFGTEDLAQRRARLGTAFLVVGRPALDPAETAVAQVRALGHDPAEVTDIVLTHLDLDHAGGIGDFPQARVHVFADELAAAQRPQTFLEKRRYVPAQWAHGPHWVNHETAGDQWLGFESVAAVGDDVLLVPLRGHTRGHCGVAVRRPSGGWFLHGGDSYFSHGEKDTPPSCPTGLALFQALVQVDKSARVGNQARLRSLHAEHGPDSGAAEIVSIFSAHDATEYDAVADVTD